MNEQNCPRRDPHFPYAPGLAGLDTWEADDTCSYCGSLNPEVLMARLEAGDVELGPTDKNYKVYVHNKSGAQFKQTYRNCPSDSSCTGPRDCTHWVTREVEQTKFYFQHFSVEQQLRFIEMLNAGRIALGYPGYFYNLPFFCRRGS